MKRNITINLEKAREWYNSGNASLKKVALQAFNETELAFNYANIKTFKNACDVLSIDYKWAECQAAYVEEVSKASAAMFKLNIIRKALNLNQDLHLTKAPKNSYIYYPYNPFVTENSTYYKSEINSGEMEIIGKIKSKGEEYNVLGDYVGNGGNNGLGSFSSYLGVGDAFSNIGFLGCVNKEIARHFSKYFGMLITEAKYGDLVDFEIIENKYQ